MLEIFDDMRSKEPGFVTDRRPRIEHSQIMTLDDLERAGRLGGKGCLLLLVSLFIPPQSSTVFSRPTRRSTHEGVLLIADNVSISTSDMEYAENRLVGSRPL